MVFVFVSVTFVNANTNDGGIDCVEMAIEVGNWAEESGASNEEAYEEALQAYDDCMAWQG